MANLPPGDPKLVSLIVSHLKSQGLFDQFRRDCLADVDTKPAYQNLRQRVDNFVSNHLANHTWSPHLNKNQLRNNIRQQVLKSGMLESGIDRIISQVVDPKINHTFRPQVEKVVQEFLATLNNKEDANVNHEQAEEKSESSLSVTGSASMVGPSTSVANDAMSILETISSLNQEATAAWALSENSNPKNPDKVSRKPPTQSIEVSTEEALENDKPAPEVPGESSVEPLLKAEEINDISPPAEDIKNSVNEAISSTQSKDTPSDIDEQRMKSVERVEKKIEVTDKSDRKEEKKEIRTEKKNEHVKRSDDTTRQKDEKSGKEKEGDPEPAKLSNAEKSSSKQRAADSMKEECALPDSDLDAFSDVTVSSVHTSDLSSFEEDSDDEEDAVSDSTEEGEITSDDEEDKVDPENKAKSSGEHGEAKPKGTRHAYVHKPFLYSKYYSDSDDELTVEQRRQSVAKEKEERLLRRQLKRERLEEKRKQKALERSKAMKMKNHGGTSDTDKGLKPKSSTMKEVLKEQMFLEKKVALSRKKKSEPRMDPTSSLKLKSELLDEDSRDTQKSNESLDRSSSSTREPKSNTSRTDASKASRKLLEPTEHNKNDSRGEKEFKKRTTFLEKMQENETSDTRKHVERLDSTSEDNPKPKNVSRSEKLSKRDSIEGDSQNAKSTLRKEPKPHKHERERTYSEERPSSKHRHKSDGMHRQATDESDSQKSKRSSKDEEQLSKHSQSKSGSEERTDRKNKQKSDGKSSSSCKDERSSDHTTKIDGGKRERHQSTEKSRPENRNKRLASDSRQHKEFKRSHSSSNPVQKSKSSADDKNEADSANSDNSRQEESVKDKKRTHISSEEKTHAKAKFKSSNKSPKRNDQEDANQKSEKERIAVEDSTEKYRKSKSEDKEEDRRDNAVPQSSSTSKDASHKSKHSDKSKERARPESKDRDLLKLDKKYSGEISKLKHSHKDERRKSESGKLEERYSKYPEEKKVQDRSSSSDRKSNKKTVSDPRSESFKGSGTKKGMKLDSELDTQSITIASESKDIERQRENKKPGKTHLESTEKANNEATESVASLGNSSFHSVTEATTSKKSMTFKPKTKHGSYDSRDSSGAIKNVTDSLQITATYDYNTSSESSVDNSERNKMDLPSTQNSVAVQNESDAGTPAKKSRNSGYEIGVRTHLQPRELENSAQGQSESAFEPSNIDNSSLSPDDVYSEITDSNDGEISTSDLAEEDGKCTKDAIKKESMTIPVQIDSLEPDNLVTGNNVEGEASAMDIDTYEMENFERSSAAEDGSAVVRRGVCSVNVTCTERNVGSSIMEASQGQGGSSIAVLSGSDNKRVKEIECEDAATSSSSVIETTNALRLLGEETATSSNTTLDISTDKICIEVDTVNLDNSRGYTSSASADGNFVEDDGDFTMLSENSFEDATTTSSTDRNLFHDNTESSETCSQSTSDNLPEQVSIVTFKPATSSANRESTESTQENAASSSNNAEGSPALRGSHNDTHTATSSDTTSEGTESAVAHIATSSESYFVPAISENITTQAATSSVAAAEIDGALGMSERHTATSSSSVVNSSRGLNFDVSLVSSEIDGEHVAASSSNLLDNSMTYDSLERESDSAASSSSSSRRSNHTFGNAEESKNTRATSSTEQDGMSDTCTNVISSGTPKEYPGNSSDLAMDSSTEVFIGSNLYSGSTSSCSSSGGGQSSKFKKQSKDNRASSSSGDPLVLRQTSSEEAASSSSSFRQTSINHPATLTSENTEATASSSIVVNISTDHFDRSSPGNSSDATATSSSNSTRNNVSLDLYPNTQPTASSSVIMDSSTEEDLSMRCAMDLDRGKGTATSSDVLGMLCTENTVRNDEVPASSSTMAANMTKENVESAFVDKANEQTATSSDMMDSSIEDDKSCAVISNNAYSSTSLNNDSSAIKDGDVNSEATAASSSNAMESSFDDNNATSSDYVMGSSVEGEIQDLGPSRNDEAASSSSFSDGIVQEVQTEASIDRPVADDATTSSSTERENDLGERDGNVGNETGCETLEMSVESSFADNHRSTAISGTSEEVAVYLSDANNDSGCIEANSEDGENDVSYEKEDAVSSASSEEQKHVCSVSRQLGDRETDGVVTSASTGARVTPCNRESSEAYGHVTCADKVVSFDTGSITVYCPVEVAVSHTSDLDTHERQESEAFADNRDAEDPDRNASAENVQFEGIADVVTDHETSRPANQPVLEEGEGAVTSTGISEENYGVKQDNNACCATESTESSSMMSRPASINSRVTTEDDESAITSTGAKEDEEEGEGFVTSTGSASEDSSFSISVDRNSSNLIHTAEHPRNLMNSRVEEDAVERLEDEEGAEEQIAKEAVAEERNAEEAVVEERDVEEAVVEEGDAEEAVVEERAVEEAVVKEQAVEKAVVEEQDAEEAVVEERDAEEAVVEEQDAEEAVVEERDAEEAVVEERDAEEAVVEERDAEEAVVEARDAEEAVVEARDAEEAVVEARDAEEAVVEERDVEEAVVEERDAEEAAEEAVVEEWDAEEAVMEELDVEEAVMEELDVEEAVVEKEAVGAERAEEEAVVDERDAEEAVMEEWAAEKVVVEERDAEEAVVEERDAEEAVVEERDAEEAVVEERDVEEAVVEERDAEEAVMEERDVEEAVVEERDAEEAVVEKRDVEEAMVEKRDAEEAVVEKRDAEEKGVGKRDAEEAVVEKWDAEEAVVEKQDAEEAVVQQRAAEESVVEKRVVEEAVLGEQVEKEAGKWFEEGLEEDAVAEERVVEEGAEQCFAEKAVAWGEVEKVGQVFKSVINVSIAPVRSLNRTSENECIPSSVKSAVVSDHSAVKFLTLGAAEDSEEKLDDLKKEYQCISDLDTTASVESEGSLTESPSEASNAFLDSQTTHTDKVAHHMLEEENMLHTALSEEHLEDGKEHILSSDKGEAAPVTVGKSSNSDEDVSLEPSQCTVSDHTMTGEPSNKLEESEETPQTNEDINKQAKECHNTTSDHENQIAVFTSDPIVERVQPAQDAESHALELNDKDKSRSVKMDRPKEPDSITKLEDSDPAKKSEDKDLKDEGKAEGTQSDPKTGKVQSQPVAQPEKRKRGRPPKRRTLLLALAKQAEAAAAAAKQASEAQRPVDEKDKSDNNEGDKDVSSPKKNESNLKTAQESSSDRSPAPVSRRGRKSKRSLSSSETDCSEPEKKRKKSECIEEDEDEDGEGEDSEDDEEDGNRGATTRAASRLEAQRKLPHKPTTRAASKLSSPGKSSPAERRRKVASPESKTGKATKNRSTPPPASGTKRRREASPSTPRSRGQCSPDETAAKRIKRQ